MSNASQVIAVAAPVYKGCIFQCRLQRLSRLLRRWQRICLRLEFHRTSLYTRYLILVLIRVNTYAHDLTTEYYKRKEKKLPTLLAKRRLDEVLTIFLSCFMYTLLRVIHLSDFHRQHQCDYPTGSCRFEADAPAAVRAALPSFLLPPSTRANSSFAHWHQWGCPRVPDPGGRDRLLW